MKKQERNIELLVRGVLARDGYLLVCRNRRKGNIYLPGGHLEWGETVIQALRREMREELGFDVRVGRFLGGCQCTFVENRRRVWEINLCFEMRGARLRPPTPPPSKEEKIEFLWMPLRDMARSNLKPDILREELARWLKSGRPTWVSPASPGGQGRGRIARTSRASLPSVSRASRLRAAE